MGIILYQCLKNTCPIHNTFLKVFYQNTCLTKHNQMRRVNENLSKELLGKKMTLKNICLSCKTLFHFVMTLIDIVA